MLEDANHSSDRLSWRSVYNVPSKGICSCVGWGRVKRIIQLFSRCRLSLRFLIGVKTAQLRYKNMAQDFLMRM
jgi:hypothetical protein